MAWKKGIDYPEFMNDVSLSVLSRGYLLPDETPMDAYTRVSSTIANRLSKPELQALFYEAMIKGWLCLASPVLSNIGTDRGYGISCFGGTIGNSIGGIARSNAEMMMLSKKGGGVSLYYNNVSGRGTPIGNNGMSEGIVPWIKINDSSILATSQGSIRRGAATVGIDVYHTDLDEFLDIRRPKGDVNRQCLNINHFVTIDDEFMRRKEAGDPWCKKTWGKILKTRSETGEPYLIFKDNINKANPQAYINNNLLVETSNLCTEITLYTDELHSFVCCLSSLNLSKYLEWKDYRFSNGMSLPYLATFFLDGVLEDFIYNVELKIKTAQEEYDKVQKILKGTQYEVIDLVRSRVNEATRKLNDAKLLENTLRSAKKGRAIGLG